MKKIYTIQSLALMLMVFFITNIGYAQTFSGGDGSGTNPYQIGTANDLIELYSTPSIWGEYKNYQLIADIDMDGQTFHPLGYDIQGGASQPFTGTFDGNHHIIKNLTVTPHDDQTGVGGGFIGISGDLNIKNLGLVDINVPFKGVAERVGGLVGFLQWNSTVENCFVVGGTVSGNGRVGGLIGNMTGLTLINSFAAVHVDANWGDNGGLVGSNHSAFVETGSISNCAFYGTVVNSKPALGLHNALFSDIYCTSTTGAADDQNPAVSILTPQELTEQANYTSLDFTNTWEMKENSFAVLQGFPAEAYNDLLTFMPIPLKVTSDGSTPIASANVSIDTDNDGTDEDYTTNAEGLLSDLILPGTYAYNISAMGYIPQEGNVTAEFGGEIKVITLLPSDADVYAVTLNVTDSKERIVENANVLLTNNSTYNQTKVTNAEGNVSFGSLLAGTYEYSISKDLHITESGTITVVDQDITENVVLAIDNKAPVADAGTNATYSSGELVTLNASLSSDVNGDQLTYNWTAPNDITLDVTNPVMPTFTAPNVAETADYVFSLVVNDGELDSEPATVTITVKGGIIVGHELLTNGGFEDALTVGWTGLNNFETSDIVPDENTSSTQSVKIATTTQVDGVQTASENFFPITIGKKYLLKGKVRADKMTMTAVNFRLMPHDTWFDKAKVAITKPGVDWGGPQAVIGEWVAFEQVITITTDYMSGSVEGDTFDSKLHIQSAPDVTDELLYIDDLSLVEYDIALEVSAGDDQEVAGASIVNLSGTHNSSEVLEVLWTAPEGIDLIDANTLTPSFVAPNLEKTTDFIITLSVKKGSLEVTDDVKVTVLSNINLIADAGEDQTVLAREEVTLDASASTPKDASFEWTAPQGITLSDVTSAIPTFTAPDVLETTEYIFSVKVSYLDMEATDNLTVTVIPDIDLVANAGDDQEVTVGSLVTLDASASTPSNATFEWMTPYGIELSDVNAIAPTFTAPNVSEITEYTFKVTVSYQDMVDTDEVVITIRPKVISSSDDVNTAIAEIYPNPTTGVFSIELQEKATVAIIDLTGQYIKSVELKQGSHTLDISQLTASIYFIQIQTDSKTQTIKLIKN